MKTIKQIIREEIDNSFDWIEDIEPNQEDIMKFIRTEKPEVWRFGKHWEGNLDLRGTSIVDLGELETVSGFLILSGTRITDLGNLKSVSGGLNLHGTSITNLGNLERVGGSLFLENTPLSKKYSEWEIRSMVSVGWDVFL